MPDDAIERARLEATTLRMLLAASGTNLTAEAGRMINTAFASFASFASQQAPEGWKPIADAPNDAREMLGWTEGCGFEVVRVDSSGKCYAGAFDADWVKFVRPLPAPPAMLDAAPSVTLGEVG